MKLASTRTTHFTESDARHIVSANLRDLLAHCRDRDESVRKSAHYLLLCYGAAGLPLVQQLIAKAMLGLMEDLLPEFKEVSEETSNQAMLCSQHVRNVWRVLAHPQRQKWVSLLVRVLQGQPSSPMRLIDDLKHLWRADGDPRRSYAEAEQHLRAWSKNVGQDLRREIWTLFRC